MPFAPGPVSGACGPSTGPGANGLPQRIWRVGFPTQSILCMYWPGIDKDIERLVSDCATCQEHRNVPPSTEFHPWEWPDKPWSRQHTDFAGPFLGNMFLLLVDAHFKWMDIYTMSSITSEATIGNLKASFSTHGSLYVLVTDNGPSFKSESFHQFVSLNGIQHLTSYHPASNGLAERAVQTFKNAMKKLSGGSVQDRVNRFLFRYQVTPQSTTGHSPTELLFNRRIKCPLDLPCPDLKSKICEKQRAFKARHDEKAVNQAFQEIPCSTGTSLGEITETSQV